MESTDGLQESNLSLQSLPRFLCVLSTSAVIYSLSRNLLDWCSMSHFCDGTLLLHAAFVTFKESGNMKGIISTDPKNVEITVMPGETLGDAGKNLHLGMDMEYCLSAEKEKECFSEQPDIFLWQLQDRNLYSPVMIN